METNVSQGPPQVRPPHDVLIGRKKAGLWSAVWEASQLLSFDEIREHVEATLREIESDAE